MFIGYFKLNREENFNIYYKNVQGYNLWHKDTFSPDCEDIAILDFTIKGKTYAEKRQI